MNYNTKLSEDELRALMNRNEGYPMQIGETLTDAQRDGIGEISNISFGSAATVLSTLLSQRVEITTPEVVVCRVAEVQHHFLKPSVVVTVEYSAGLSGANALTLELEDAKVIADLMMGGDGSVTREEMTELHLSAVAEAMNQMMGGAASAMSAMFRRSINITPPSVRCVDFKSGGIDRFGDSQWVVSVSFRLRIGQLTDSTLTQWIPLEFARELLRFMQPEPQTAESSNRGGHPVDGSMNLGVLLNVELTVAVELGRTKKPLREILDYSRGSMIQLDKLAGAPVDILVNNQRIGVGEVMVWNDTFSVRVTDLLSHDDWVRKLKS